MLGKGLNQPTAKSIAVKAPRQQDIWKLREKGDLAHARELEVALAHSLENDKVVRVVPFLAGGAQGKQLVTLESGIQGVWATMDGIDGSWKNEVASSIIDRLYSLNRVPMTVPRIINGKKGSLQLFISNFKVPTDEAFRKHTLSQEFWFTQFVGNDSNKMDARGELKKKDGIGFRGSSKEILVDNNETFGVSANHSPKDIEFNFDFSIVGAVRDKLHAPLQTLVPPPVQLAAWKAIEDRQFRASLRGVLPKKAIDQAIERKNYYLKIISEINPPSAEVEEGFNIRANNDPKEVEQFTQHLISNGAIFVTDLKYIDLQNNKLVNCHGFSVAASNVPEIPRVSWINPGSRVDGSDELMPILNEYFVKKLKIDYQKTSTLENNKTLEDGDVIVLRHSGWPGISPHSGILIKRKVGPREVFWMRSKMAEGAILDAPIEIVTSNFGDWDYIEVFRRK